MQALNYKPEFSGASRQPAETAASLAKSRQESRTASKDSMTSLVAGTMLALEKVTGAVLGGMATAVLAGNVLICAYLLMLGPEYIVKLLVRLNGTSL